MAVILAARRVLGGFCAGGAFGVCSGGLCPAQDHETLRAFLDESLDSLAAFGDVGTSIPMLIFAPSKNVPL